MKNVACRWLLSRAVGAEGMIGLCFYDAEPLGEHAQDLAMALWPHHIDA